MAPPPSLSRRDLVALAPISGIVAGTVAFSATVGAAPPGSTPRVFEPGIHRLAADTRFDGDVLMMPGAVLDVAAGAVVSFSGDLIAGGARLFTGTGRVDLNSSRVVAARPEWWGAAPDDPAVDCIPSLDACLRAHHYMQLATGDYHLFDTWKVALSGRRIWGTGRGKETRGTRLVRRGGDGAVVLVGSEAAPPSINDYATGIDMRWIELARTAPANAPDGGAGLPPAGLAVRHVLDCVFEGLRAQEHAIGFSVHGAVRSFLRDCSAFRSAPSGAHGRDVFIGFDLGGPAQAGAAGGNASLYVVDCLARTGGAPALAVSIGARLLGEVADTFVIRLETTSLAEGIVVDGRRDQLNAAQRRAGHADVHIETPVLDQCASCGIRLANLSDHTLLDIRDPYVALAPGSGVAIDIRRCGGGIAIDGGQLIGWVARSGGGTPTGIRIEDAAGVAIQGARLLEFATPVEAVRATGFELVVAVNAPDTTTPGPAISLTDCAGGYLRPRVFGAARAYGTGVAVAGKAERITIDATGIDPRALAGGASVTVGGHPLRPGAPGPVQLIAPHG